MQQFYQMWPRSHVGAAQAHERRGALLYSAMQLSTSFGMRNG